MMPNLETVLPLLVNQGVRVIVVGGVAGNFHGSARATFDLDLVYARTPENLRGIVAALQPYAPYLRGAPPGLPFRWEERTLRQGLNFTLTTTLGDIDLLGEITGGGAYEDLLPHTAAAETCGVTVRYVTLPKLIELKNAAGRPKDLEAIAELKAILEELQRAASGG